MGNFRAGLLFLCSLGLSASVSAQDIGVDLLGLQHPLFPVADVVEMIRPGFVGGHLDGSFETSLKPVERVLNTGHVVRWRVHIFNGPGLRNGNLGRLEPHYGRSIGGFSRAWEKRDSRLRSYLGGRVTLYCRLFERHPEATLEISPTLEHNLSRAAFREQARTVKRRCPAAIVVDNPVAGVPGVKGFKLERHGIAASVRPPCNASLDGDDFHEVDVSAYLQRFSACETRYLWSRALNGRLASGPFIDPRHRTAWPSRDELRQLLKTAGNS